jgi:type II secretory pathway pseudopilin PulG
MVRPKKGLAIASLVLGILGLPTAGLLVLGALIGIVLGIVALVQANKTPETHGGVGVAIAGIATNCFALALTPVIAGIIAAIAIPNLLRSRVVANESAVIGDIRTITSAEAAYAGANGGYYDRLECLSYPYENCIPDYPTTGPEFLDYALSTAQTKNGYNRKFHPGSYPESVEQGVPISPTSVESYAYVAVPESPGMSGVRSFCGDATGRICEFSGGEEPFIQDGACPIDCKPIQ